MKYEVEMKFPVSDWAALEARLAELGATISAAQAECDVYFAHPARDFARTDEALRVAARGRQTFSPTRARRSTRPPRPATKSTCRCRRKKKRPRPGSGCWGPWASRLPARCGSRGARPTSPGRAAAWRSRSMRSNAWARSSNWSWSSSRPRPRPPSGASRRWPNDCNSKGACGEAIWNCCWGLFSRRACPPCGDAKRRGGPSRPVAPGPTFRRPLNVLDLQCLLRQLDGPPRPLLNWLVSLPLK